MRSRGNIRCTWLVCACLAAFGGLHCTDNKTQPLSPAPAEPVAFAVHVTYCQNGAPGLAVPGTVVRLTQGGTTLEATSDANGLADFGDLPPGVYELAVSRETRPQDPLCVSGGDLNTVIQMFAGIRVLGTCNLAAADVLQDGDVTTQDLQALRRWVVFDFASGGHTAEWRFTDTPPQADVREAATLEVHAVLLGDADLSWPVRY